MTRAEWDAERNRRSEAMHTLRHPLEISMSATDSMFYGDLATATMPPCPVEPPSVKYGEWTITHNGFDFSARGASGNLFRFPDAVTGAYKLAVYDQGECLALDLIALRDGPLPVVTP